RQHVVDDVVAGCTLGQIIDCGHVQQQLEIERRVVLQGTQDILHTIALDRDRKIAAKLTHVQELVRKTLLECRCYWSSHFVVLFEKPHKRAGRTLKTMDS